MRKKGIVDIEFVVSIGVFLSVIVFVSFTILNYIPLFHKEAQSEIIKARSYQVSQIILFDQGEPANWDGTNVLRIGLSSGYPYNISTQKINNLRSICTDYNRFKTLLGQDFRNDIKIYIDLESGENILSCGPAVNTTILPEVQSVRYAVISNGSISKITVSIL